MLGPSDELGRNPVGGRGLGEGTGPCDPRDRKSRHETPAVRADRLVGGHRPAAVRTAFHDGPNYLEYISLDGPLRPRCVAIATLDAALYEDLARELRARGLPSVSVVPGARLPESVAIVLTSPAEARLIRHPQVVAVRPVGERRSLWAMVASALEPSQDPREAIVVGIDPGPRPGYAVMAGERCLEDGVLEDPEAVGELADHLVKRFPSRPVEFRVGNGDRVRRDRILNALTELPGRPQIVDERGTTPRGRRRPRDALAARAIALGHGRAAPTRTPILLTDGEIANLQRMSREGSGGRFTLPREEAARVLRGELSLADALSRAPLRRHGPSPSGPRPSP